MKGYKVSTDHDARVEIKRVTNWYNNLSSGLGDRFRALVFQQIDSLAETPRLYAIRYGKVRTMPIRGFPYSIHFVVNESEESVIVYNVLHENINPNLYPRA